MAMQLPAQSPSVQLDYSVIYVSPSPTAAVAGPFTVGSGGVLYASAPEGGLELDGTVVAFTPPSNGGAWATTTIHRFTAAEGTDPFPGLILGSDGSLYGSLFGEGPAGSGAVFRLVPPAQPGNAWTEETVYAFSESEGGLPIGNMTAGPGGQLYGVIGGDYSHPTSIYQLTPPGQAGGAWTRTFIYSIGINAVINGGLSFGSNGVLYVNTGNLVFGLVLSGTGSNTTATEVPVYNLASDGLSSNAPVLVLPSGTLLLATTGGTQYGQIIALTKPATKGVQWTRTNLYTFSFTDGAYPEGPLTPIGHGILLGTTFGGGTTGDGTIYALSAPSTNGAAWSVQLLHSFPNEDENVGFGPTTGVVVNQGAIFGLASLNGNTEETVGFELTASTP